jgi:hypothetical protein
MSFCNGKPFPWKMEEWKADYEKNQPEEEK